MICDLKNLNQITDFLNQISNRITMFQIKSLFLKSLFAIQCRF